MTPKEFFVALYDSKDDNHYICLFEIDKFGKNKHKIGYYKNIREAVAYVEKNRKNCFYNVCTTKKSKPHGRPLATEASGLPGLYIDIDIADPVHKKNNLPPDYDTAIKIVNEFPLAPTMIVDSGHGLHVYWLFKEFWTFDDDDEHRQAAKLLMQFQFTLKQIFGEHGYSLDSTFDLARVLRVVGGINEKKAGEALEVKILEFEETRRYNPGDFDDVLAEMTQSPQRPQEGGTGRGVEASIGTPVCSPEIAAVIDKGLVLAPGRNLAPDLFVEISEAFKPDFMRTWNKERDDEMTRDNSPSAYDYALMNFGVQAGLKDQELVDLCVGFRGKHGFDLKDIRYYARSIAKIRKNTQTVEGIEAAEEAADLSGSVYGDKEKSRKALCKRLGFDDIRIFEYQEDPIMYVIKILYNGKKYEIRSTNYNFLTDPHHFAKSVSIRTKKHIIFKKGEFGSTIYPMILELIEEVEVENELTLKGNVKDWLIDYLITKSDGSLESRAPLKEPFLHTDGHWYIYPKRFHEWIRINGSQVAHNSMIHAMKKLGIEAVKLDIVINGARTTTRPWQVPADLIAQNMVKVDLSEEAAQKVVYLKDRDCEDR